MIEIVAELSANHNGSLAIALKMIKAAHESGATMIKAQAYTPDNIAVKGLKIKKGLWNRWDYHNLYTKGQTPFEWFPTLKKASEYYGMEFFASAFDFEAVDMLEKLEVKRHKVASFEITDIPLIEYMVSKKKPLIVSTGIANDEDIELVELTTKGVDVVWLVCTSSYPTSPQDVGLKRMEFFGFDMVGLSDHTKGIIAPVLSVAYDPVLIEKHFILDHSIKTIDSEFSSDPKEFREMVEAVREAEKMNTYKEPKVDRQFARSLWIVKDVKKGELLTKENVKSLRPNKGLHPFYYKEVINKLSTKDIKAPCPLKKSYL